MFDLPTKIITELTTMVYQLAGRVRALEAEVRELRRAAVAHAGDYDAHPCSNNDALEILRALEPPDQGTAGGGT